MGRTRIVAAVRENRRRVSAWAPLALLLVACGPEDSARDILALTNARVVDGNGGPALDNVTVVIEDGRITLVGPTAAVTFPAGAGRQDLSPG